MTSFQPATIRKIVSYLAVLAIVFGAILTVPTLLTARPDGMVITVTNGTGRGITHMYLAAPDKDDWSEDQLHDAILGPGQSVTISGVTCGALGVKVIGEDRDGCFVSKVLTCAASGSWTISNANVPDCGN